MFLRCPFPNSHLYSVSSIICINSILTLSGKGWFSNSGPISCRSPVNILAKGHSVRFPTLTALTIHLFPATSGTSVNSSDRIRQEHQALIGGHADPDGIYLAVFNVEPKSLTPARVSISITSFAKAFFSDNLPRQRCRLRDLSI